MTERSSERLVVLAAEQRRLDAMAEAAGVSSDAPVESAGRSAAEWILANAPTARAVVAAGPGGNGADGLVVARHLRAAGIDVETFLVTPASPSASAARALAALEGEGGSVVVLRGENADLEPFACAATQADLVVDALYGSGLTRPLAGAAADVVAAVEGASATVVSLDVPSGIGADGGDVLGPAVRADVTLAMEFLKPAHLFYPAAGLCGRIVVVDVAYPDDVLAHASPFARVLQSGGARRRLPLRPPTGHKGTFGHVLLLAGSRGMLGAAILAGRAALRAGAGLVTLAVPASQAATVHAALPEALVAATAEESGHIVPAALSDLRSALGRATVLAVGPGLSRGDAVAAAVTGILDAYGGPVVVDADAVHALSREPRGLRAVAGRAVLTPHPGEFAHLTARDAASVDRDRVAAVGSYAREHGVIVLLKGRPTAIGLPEGQVYLNPTGNSGLATGGSGDVLTGLLAGLVASGASLEDAALLGPYVHGLAAELFAADAAERSLLPSDVVELLPRAFLEVERCA